MNQPVHKCSSWVGRPLVSLCRHPGESSGGLVELAERIIPTLGVWQKRSLCDTSLATKWVPSSPELSPSLKNSKQKWNRRESSVGKGAYCASLGTYIQPPNLCKDGDTGPELSAWSLISTHRGTPRHTAAYIHMIYSMNFKTQNLKVWFSKMTCVFAIIMPLKGFVLLLGVFVCFFVLFLGCLWLVCGPVCGCFRLLLCPCNRLSGGGRRKRRLLQ